MHRRRRCAVRSCFSSGRGWIRHSGESAWPADVAAELASHAVFADPGHQAARELLASALERLAAASQRRSRGQRAGGA